MKGRFKLKITTIDNEPIIKAQGDRIDDFDPIIDGLKEKFGDRRKCRH